MTIVHNITKLIKSASGNMLDEIPTYFDESNHIINFICEMP